MTERAIDGDFTACDTAVLNEFFAAYRGSHTQGGTNTRQRNLHHLFGRLAKKYGHPDPWTPDLVRYGPVKSRPSTLAEEFIRGLLEITGAARRLALSTSGTMPFKVKGSMAANDRR
jgi:hypothetical protein